MGSAKKPSSAKAGTDNLAQAVQATKGDKSQTRRRVGETIRDLDGIDPGERHGLAGRPSRRQSAAARYEPRVRPNGQLYYPREVPGTELTDVELLQTARRATNDPDPTQRRELYILLSGEPGCGKTALVEAAFGDELITVEGTGETELTDLVGTFIHDPENVGGFLWIPGPLYEAMQQGRPLLIDDATLIPPNVLAKIYPAMDGRRQLTVSQHRGEKIVAEFKTQASDGFFVIMSHNPGAPGAMLADAMNSRCRLQIDVQTDLTLAPHLDIPNNIVEIARALQELRDDEGTTGEEPPLPTELDWAPEMRELIAFRDVAALFGPRVAARNLLGQVQDLTNREIIRQTLQEKFGEDLSPLSLGSSKFLG
jgi:hypothetical protein